MFYVGLLNTGCLALRSRIYALYIRNTRIYRKIHHVCEYVWNQQIQYEKQEIRSMERRIYVHVRVTNCIILVHKSCNLMWIKWVIVVLACLQGLGLRVYADVGFHAEICRVSRQYRVSRRNISGFTPKYIGFHANIRINTPFTYEIRIRPFFGVFWGRFWEMAYVQSNTDTVQVQYETYVTTLVLCGKPARLGSSNCWPNCLHDQPAPKPNVTGWRLYRYLA